MIVNVYNWDGEDPDFVTEEEVLENSQWAKAVDDLLIEGGVVLEIAEAVSLETTEKTMEIIASKKLGVEKIPYRKSRQLKRPRPN